LGSGRSDSYSGNAPCRSSPACEPQSVRHWSISVWRCFALLTISLAASWASLPPLASTARTCRVGHRVRKSWVGLAKVGGLVGRLTTSSASVARDKSSMEVYPAFKSHDAIFCNPHRRVSNHSAHTAVRLGVEWGNRRTAETPLMSINGKRSVGTPYLNCRWRSARRMPSHRSCPDLNSRQYITRFPARIAASRNRSYKGRKIVGSSQMTRRSKRVWLVILVQNVTGKLPADHPV
jgi:hypothetical protein